jgi:hypothetical protein
MATIAQHAFELLEASDYLAQPSKEALQTLLLLGNVLQNEMKPQAAWALGGTTVRLAQCLGIHKRMTTSRLFQVPLAPHDASCLRYVVLYIESCYPPPDHNL